MTEQVALAFDYDGLDASTRATVETCRDEIRSIARGAVAEIGRRLLRVRDELARYGGGTFRSWLEAEFEFSHQTAYNYMAVARTFPDLSNSLTIDARALYALASGDVPEKTREHFIAQAEAGEPVRYRDVKAAIQDVKARMFVCRTCDEAFSLPVWHCPACAHHWEEGRDQCGNCYRDRSPNVTTHVPAPPLPHRHACSGKRVALSGRALRSGSSTRSGGSWTRPG